MARTVQNEIDKKCLERKRASSLKKERAKRKVICLFDMNRHESIQPGGYN